MMRKGINERKSPSSSPRLDCDVGLGLKMPADSYYSDAHNFGADSLWGFASRGGKALFTASQLEELERQKMIHRYIMASIPVPPHLLLPTRSPPPQCNRSGSGSGLELRFSSSDPEPWRCKRTDGKKWRCSRDVAPDLKYCERHAHKSRPRSRKLVELSSHKPIMPTFSPASSYHQTRCIEWFMKGGSDTNSVSISTPGPVMLPRTENNSNSNAPFKLDDKQPNDFMSLNPYIPDTSNLRHEDQNPSMDAKMTQTRHFIDAWEKEGYDLGMGMGMGSKGVSLSTKFPISPLSLSMCGGDYDDGGKGDLGVGVMRENEGVLNSVSWTNSPPGGPLGEALCLGNATTTRGSYGYSNNNTNTNTNSSICSKSFCEDGSYALNFIGDS